MVSIMKSIKIYKIENGKTETHKKQKRKRSVGRSVNGVIHTHTIQNKKKLKVKQRHGIISKNTRVCTYSSTQRSVCVCV